MKKIKPILPSLREKKRYLVYEVIGNDNLTAEEIEKSIKSSYLTSFGEVELGNAGLIFLNKQFNKKKQKGIIRVNNKCVDNLRYSLALIKDIKKSDVIIHSIGCSGIINKTKQYLN
jgi:ribonuclease P/MRP protein subunit POP5